MAKTKETDVSGNVPEMKSGIGDATSEANTPVATGQDIGGTLTMRTLVSLDWIRMNVAAKPIGHRENFGRLVGEARGFEIRPGKLPDGTEKDSIALLGLFRVESLITGVVTEGHTIYLPENAARRIMATLALEGTTAVQLDIDLGVMSTGKTIPFAYTATTWIKDRASELLETMANARVASRIPLLSAADQKQISG